MGLKTENPFLPLGFQAIIASGSGATNITGDDNNHELFRITIPSTLTKAGDMIRLNFSSTPTWTGGSIGGNTMIISFGSETVASWVNVYPTGHEEYLMEWKFIDFGLNDKKNCSINLNSPAVTAASVPAGGVLGTAFDVVYSTYVPTGATIQTHWAYYIEVIPNGINP